MSAWACVCVGALWGCTNPLMKSYSDNSAMTVQRAPGQSALSALLTLIAASWRVGHYAVSSVLWCVCVCMCVCVMKGFVNACVRVWCVKWFVREEVTTSTGSSACTRACLCFVERNRT